ncbi:leucine-rich repeat-containing protein 63 [Spea bombifrons]|uniref:leucine-rich repeat-containing protein 63 n=1 Tax=Spea bombifrons TaxID=233779 RepID=UPI00234B24F5|nr:leucine-rich repeat-containing protein 63 [Spea bombifrons]
MESPCLRPGDGAKAATGAVWVQETGDRERGTEMEAPFISLKSPPDPPKLLRKPLPPKVLPALDVQRPKTSNRKVADWILGQPSPIPDNGEINGAHLPLQGKGGLLQSRLNKELICRDQAQNEETKNSGSAHFPSRTQHWRPPVNFLPAINDNPVNEDLRFQPPPPKFTLNDLIARSCQHKMMSETLSKPTISHQHYSNIELFISNLQNGKQTKLHKVVLSPNNIPMKPKRIPQQQLLLEQLQEMFRKGRIKHMECTGNQEALQEMLKSQYMEDTQNIHSDQEDDVLVTYCDLALLECLVHGGSSLSLKAFFISKVPDLTPVYTTLIYLNLSFNELQYFPTEVYNLENLEVLKLRNNPIKEIPFGIHNLKNLRTCVMSFCLLSSLPAGLFVLPYLQKLDISYNSISSIPNDICNLRVLEFLNVEGNMLPALPRGALKLHLKNLRVGNNAMHPLFWRENTHIKPQRLADLAALSFAKNNMEKYFTAIPEEVKYTLQNFKDCDCCRGPLYGQGLRFIRPCEKIFGIRKLPFMFHSCSPSCYENFMSQTDSVAQHLYES